MVVSNFQLVVLLKQFFRDQAQFLEPGNRFFLCFFVGISELVFWNKRCILEEAFWSLLGHCHLFSIRDNLLGRERSIFIMKLLSFPTKLEVSWSRLYLSKQLGCKDELQSAVVNVGQRYTPYITFLQPQQPYFKIVSKTPSMFNNHHLNLTQ